MYYRLKPTPYKWLDVKKLLELTLKEYHEISKIKYFTALVKASSKDPSKPERQMAYWRALESYKNLEIIKGCFKKRKIKGAFLCPLDKGIKKGELVTVQKYEEKESDVNIASHILLDCHKEKFDCIVLLSNDTDLKTPLSFARNKFNKKIGIISTHKTKVHSDLQKLSNFKKNITDEMLNTSLFPLKVGSVSKPDKW